MFFFLRRLGGKFVRRPTASMHLIGIHIAAEAGEAMTALDQVRVREQGLEGDRYCRGTGHWRPVEACVVTLIGSEDLARAAARGGLELGQGQHRRNLVVAGVMANSLLGLCFTLGGARFEGLKPRPPCGWLDQVAGRGHAHALGRHSGICLRVLQPGDIALGDPLRLET